MPTEEEKRMTLKAKVKAHVHRIVEEQQRKNSDPSYVLGRMEQAKSTLWQLTEGKEEGVTLDAVIGVLRNTVKWDQERLKELNGELS